MKKVILVSIVTIMAISSINAFAAVKKQVIYPMSEILKIVSANYPGEVSKIDLEYTLKNIYFEVDVINNGKKTELKVDAKTGEILKAYEEKLDADEKYLFENFAQDNALTSSAKIDPSKPVEVIKDPKFTTPKISEEQAKKIALEKVAGGKIVKIKLDYFESTPKYEVEIILGNYEYEIDVDANTGEIISFDKDHILD